MSFIEVSDCCDCGQQTYHISLASEDVSYDSDDGFCLHLDKDLAQVLYLELKDKLLHGE